ncbi:hypothetical protein [Synechococcus sp. UW179A]|uniref:hypothetical protein n=1 Tax=Synechococcus sp. UW179A TaxID=2575510 RepID=UPI0010BEFFD1|nr:hypothetical protein [Synechococcus sp. UW179A]
MTATTITEESGAAERPVKRLSQTMSTREKGSTLNHELVIFGCATTTTNFIETDVSPSPKDQFSFCFEPKLIHANIFIAKTFIDITSKLYSCDWAAFFSKNPGNPSLCLLKQ